MSNGPYAEISRLVHEGKLSGEAITRLSIELQMETYNACRDIQKQCADQSRRLDLLENNPSLTTHFKRQPVRTTIAASTLFLILDTLSHQLPNIIKLLIGLP